MNAVDARPVAFVTAASRGIGAEIARQFAREGTSVALGVRDPATVADLRDELRASGVEAESFAMDVLDLPGSRTALSDAAARFGRLDILVNNAGGGIDEPAIDVTEEHFDEVWALNTKSSFFLSQHFARLRGAAPNDGTRTPAAIVNVASQAGLVALPGEASYCVAKAAVVHLTKCLAVEWGALGIRVNAVAPTFITTDGTGEALGDPDFRADTIERIAALHRIGEPVEVATAVTFLASAAASLITGVTLAIDGGWTAR